MSEDKKYQRIYGDYFKIIQETINRMARNSFLIKAWTVTLVSAILVLTLSITNIFVLIILIGISLIFWGLDSFYLKLERCYRSLYNTNVSKYNNGTLKNLFEMDITELKKNEDRTIKIMRSDSEKYFYLIIISALSSLLIAAIIMVFI